MAEDIDWSLTTFEGLRRRQQQEFAALPLREKLERIGEANELVEYFAVRRTARMMAAGDESKGLGSGSSGAVEQRTSHVSAPTSAKPGVGGTP